MWFLWDLLRREVIITDVVAVILATQGQLLLCLSTNVMLIEVRLLRGLLLLHHVRLL